MYSFPIAHVLEAQRVWAELVDINDELVHAMSSSPSGYIKPVYANPLWIPFADHQSGNHLGIDLDPDVQGSDGQVIVFGRDENRKRLVAQSLVYRHLRRAARGGELCHTGADSRLQELSRWRTTAGAWAAPARRIRAQKLMSGRSETCSHRLIDYPASSHATERERWAALETHT